MAPDRHRPSEVALRGALAVLSLGCALLVGEFALRVVVPSEPSNRTLFWPPHVRAVFRPFPEIMPGVDGDANFITNSQGVRAPEMPVGPAYRILSIGGSTTMCAYLDQPETWPQLLQQNLSGRAGGQVWVGNAGASGLRAAHHLVAMERYPFREMEIDAVIVLLGVNDLSFRLAHEHDHAARRFDTALAREELVAETFKGSYTSYADDPPYKRLAFWQLLRRTRRFVESRRSTAHIEDDNGEIYVTWREHRRQAPEMRDELPSLSVALGDYRRTVNRIVDVAAATSTRLLLVTQPTMWQAALPGYLERLLWLGGTGDFQRGEATAYYTAAALDRAMTAYNQVVRQACIDRNVECVDLAAVLPKDTSVFYDDVHFNESGARKVSQILSHYLLERAPFAATPARP